MTNGQVSTTNKPRAVQLKRGGRVLVRRVRRADATDLTMAAGLREGEVGTFMLFEQLTARFGIIGGDGIVDDVTGEPVPFATEPHPTLGKIASRDVFNALAQEDVEAVIAAANGTAADSPAAEAVRGN